MLVQAPLSASIGQFGFDFIYGPSSTIAGQWFAITIVEPTGFTKLKIDLSNCFVNNVPLQQTDTGVFRGYDYAANLAFRDTIYPVGLTMYGPFTCIEVASGKIIAYRAHPGLTIDSD